MIRCCRLSFASRWPSTPSGRLASRIRMVTSSNQRADDGMSLTFDSAPLEEDVHILGFPVVTLELRSAVLKCLFVGLSIRRILGLAERTEVLLSPVHGQLAPDALVSWMLRDRLPVRLNLQLHKYIWSPSARGV